MKYQRVRALIVGFVFSAAAMSACGVYGSMPNEAYSVYGSVAEEADWGENEIGPGAPSRDGFDAESNQTVTIDSLSFSIPEYMTESQDTSGIASFLTQDCDNAMIFQPEETTDGTFALLVIRTGSISKLYESHKDSVEEYDPDGGCEYLSTILDSFQILDLGKQHFMMDTNYTSHKDTELGLVPVITTTYCPDDAAAVENADNTETAGDAETTGTAEAAGDVQTAEGPFTNTSYFCLSNAYFVDPDNMDRFVCLTLYQSLEPECAYNYNTDFSEIVSSVHLTEN